MERWTCFALALAPVTMLLVAGCGGRVAPTNTDGQGGDSTGTTRGGPTSKQSGNAGQGQQGSDSSGGALGGGSGDSSSGGSPTPTGSGGSNGGSSGGGANAGSGSCSVVLSNLFGSFTDVTFDGVHGGGVSEGMPWQVGCEFSDASYDYSFSATFLGGATTGHVVTTDARVTRASRTCSADCPYDDLRLAKCDFTVSVATDQAFVASFQCTTESGEDLPAAAVTGSMNVMLVPDTLK